VATTGVLHLRVLDGRRRRFGLYAKPPELRDSDSNLVVNPN